MKKEVFIMMVVFICLAMVGCISTRPTITNASSHTSEHTNQQSHQEKTTDSTFIDHYREVICIHDTIHIKDSIYVYKWRNKIIKDSIHDTLYIQNTDTITNTIQVEKPIAPFVRNSCIALWSIVGVAILALVAWIVWKFATGKISIASILTKLLSR